MAKIEINDLLKIPEYDKSFKKITNLSEEKEIFVEKFFKNNELIMKKYNTLHTLHNTKREISYFSLLSIKKWCR